MASTTPIPSAIKRLRGNPGKRRLNDREPQPAPTDDTPPPELTGDARALWERHVPEMVRLGLVTALDRDEIKLYCLLRADGLARFKTEPGWALRALEQSTRIGARYGIGAADRSRITAHPKKPESRWAGIIGGKAS
jgi:hypothetical protein